MKFRHVFISYLFVVSLMTGIAVADEDVLILQAPEPQAGARFGAAVAAFGENIIVGSPGHDSGSDFSVGQVAYLFAPDGTLLQTFRAPDTERLVRFGWTVAAVGDNVLVAAAGRVYVFALDGSHLRTFGARDIRRPDYLFGMALTVLGENVLVGSPELGRVLLFSPDGTLLQAFYSPNWREDRYFGMAVTSLGKNILAGAPVGDLMRNRSPIYLTPRRIEDVEVQRSRNAPVNRRIDHGGNIYLLAPDGTHLETFRAPDSQAGAQFGATMKVLGENVLVGAPYHDTEEGENVGQVYLFAPDGTHLRTFRAPDAQAGAQFGRRRSVAGSGGTIIVGAPFHDTDAGRNADQVYIFSGNHGVSYKT